MLASDLPMLQTSPLFINSVDDTGIPDGFSFSRSGTLSQSDFQGHAASTSESGLSGTTAAAAFLQSSFEYKPARTMPSRPDSPISAEEREILMDGGGMHVGDPMVESIESLDSIESAGSDMLSPAAEFLGSFSVPNPASGAPPIAAAESASARLRASSSVSRASIGAPYMSASYDSTTSVSSSGADFQGAATREGHKAGGAYRSFIAPDPDEEGEEVDGYIIGKLLGTGTLSTVKEATDMETGEIVAVKIVRHQQQEELFGSLGQLPQRDAQGNLAAGQGQLGSSTSGRRGGQHLPWISSSPEGPSGRATRRNTVNSDDTAQLQSSKAGSAEQPAPQPSGTGSQAGAQGRQEFQKQQQEHRPRGAYRTRSCSSPAVSLAPMLNIEGRTVEGLPPTSDVEYEELASPMSVDGRSADGDTSTRELPAEEQDAAVGAGDVSRAHISLQKEVAIWSNLDAHPHIVPLIHYYESAFASFIFMPRCATNLLQYVKEYGRGGSKSPELVPAASPAASAIAAAAASPIAIGSSLKRSASNAGSSLSRSPKAGLGRSVPPSSTPPPFAPSASVTWSMQSSSPAASTSAAGGGKVQRSSSIRLRHPHEVVQGGAGLPIPVVTKILAQVVAGLRYLHLVAHITHKDIKLENILQDAEGNFRISDFGLAHGPAQMVSLVSNNNAAGTETPLSSPGADEGTRTSFWADIAGQSRTTNSIARARREHALSDGDASAIMKQISPAPQASGVTATGYHPATTRKGTTIPFPSLGEAASSLIHSSEPTAADSQIVNLSASLPTSSHIQSGSDSKTLTSGSPPRTYTSGAGLFRSVSQRPGFSTRRSHLQSIPASLSSSIIGDATAGSLQYTSPEQIRSPAPVTDASVDIWALGCVLYAMLDGRLPFDDGFEPRLRVNIMKGDWKLPLALRRANSDSTAQQGDPGIDDAQKALIEKVLQGCLQVDVGKRWTIEQVASSKWLASAVAEIETPLSPVRGRRKRSPEDPASMDAASEQGEAPALASAVLRRISPSEKERSLSRGRPGTGRHLGAVGAFTSSSRESSKPASSRRGPSMDEYRRARESGSRPGQSRSRSRHGRASGDTWEIL